MNKLISTDEFGVKLLARGDAFKILFTCMVDRSKTAARNEQANPLMAISGACGGKTRFMCEVEDLFDDDAKRREAFQSAGTTVEDQAILDPIFQNLAPLYITYSNASSYYRDYDDSADAGLPPNGFALRVLFRFVAFHCQSLTEIQGIFPIW